MAASAKKAAPLFNLLPNGVLKEIHDPIHLLKKLESIQKSFKIAWESEDLPSRDPEQSYSSAPKKKVINLYSISKHKVRPLVEQAVEILMTNPELSGNIGQSVLDDLSRDPETKLLFDLLVWTRDVENVDKESLLIYCREKLELPSPAELGSAEIVLSLGELSKELEDTLKKITITMENLRRSELLSDITKKSLKDLTEDEKKILSKFRKKTYSMRKESFFLANSAIIALKTLCFLKEISGMGLTREL